jgi:hypothetical protein
LVASSRGETRKRGGKLQVEVARALYNGDADNYDSDVKVRKKAQKKVEDRGEARSNSRVAEKEITGETFI